MKLENVKDRIDRFFSAITAQELYEMAVLKYRFKEITFNFENRDFDTSQVSLYKSTNDDIIFDLNINSNNAESNFLVAA